MLRLVASSKVMMVTASDTLCLFTPPRLDVGGCHPCIVPSRRVLRGGSWNNNPQNLRSANRNRNNPTNRNNNVGFRVASTLHFWARAADLYGHPAGASGVRHSRFRPRNRPGWEEPGRKRPGGTMHDERARVGNRRRQHPAAVLPGASSRARKSGNRFSASALRPAITDWDGGGLLGWGFRLFRVEPVFASDTAKAIRCVGPRLSLRMHTPIPHACERRRNAS